MWSAYIIIRNGNSYISKPDGTLESIWTPMEMPPCQQVITTLLHSNNYISNNFRQLAILSSKKKS